MRKCLILGLTAAILLGSSQSRAEFSLNAENSLRIIGLVSAFGGIYSIAHKNDSFFRGFASKIGGLVLLSAGLGGAIFAKPIIDKIDAEFPIKTTLEDRATNMLNSLGNFGNQLADRISNFFNR